MSRQWIGFLAHSPFSRKIGQDRGEKAPKPPVLSYSIPCWLRNSVALLLLLLSVTNLSTVYAASNTNMAATKHIETILAALSEESSLDEIATMRTEVQEVSSDLQKQISQLQGELSQLNLLLDSVTEGHNKEEPTPVETDSDLSKAKREKETKLADLKLALLACKDAESKLEQARKKRLARNLAYRSEDLATLLQQENLSASLHNWWQRLSWPEHELAKQELEKFTPRVFVFLPALLFLLCIIVGAIPSFHQCMLRFSGANLFFYLDRFLLQKNAFFLTLVGLSSTAVLGSWIFSGEGFLYVAISWASLFFLFWTTIPVAARAILHRLVVVKSTEERGRSRVEGLLWGVFSFSTALLLLYFSNTFFYVFPPDIYAFGRFAVLFFTLGFQVFFAKYLARKLPQSKLCLFIFYTALVNFFILVILESVGYQNLVNFLLKGCVETAVLLALYVFFHDTIELLSEIAGEYSSRFFLQLIQEEEDPLRTDSGNKGGSVAKFALKVLLFFSFPYALGSVWGGAADESTPFQQNFFDGFHIGNVLLSPAMIMVAIVVVLIGWSAIHYLQQIFDRFWLRKADLSRSAREIILTISGYLGYALLLFAGLNIAGFSFAGLGMIFGALSVGIGFGLQNVVNNFVSGLILVFEQPIKKGDWIVVGSTEGYVKKISIRSTIIQTFDRADVIVPNSELISSQVQNMMLYDNRGRLRVSVGVAYGTDTRQVEKLLLTATENDSEIIRKEEHFPLRPRVYFQEFGDSSLNFDLLCYLRNIDNKLAVKSGLHFEIDRLFREHNIEIPFPQRDIHITDITEANSLSATTQNEPQHNLEQQAT